MAYMSCGGTTFFAAAMTCAKSVFTPTSCRTFGCLDLRRVPLPAAIIAMATRGTMLLVFAFGIEFNNTRVTAKARISVGTGVPPVQLRSQFYDERALNQSSAGQHRRRRPHLHFRCSRTGFFFEHELN